MLSVQAPYPKRKEGKRIGAFFHYEYCVTLRNGVV